MKTGNVHKNWEYVLKRERSLPVEERTVWKLKHLSVAEYFTVIDRESVGGYGSGILARLQAGLAGWTNLKDSNDQTLRFDVDENGWVKMELLDQVAATKTGGADLIELSNAIREKTEWTEGQEKNLDSPPCLSPERCDNSTATGAAESESN